MDCTVEAPAALHQLHVNIESAGSQFCGRVDTPPFSPTATSRPTGQSLPPVLEEVPKSPIVETQNTLTDGPSASEAVDVANPKASYAFSQLHKYMEERMENTETQAVMSHSVLNFDPPPEQVKRESQKWKNRSTKSSIEIALQQEASFKFNAVLVELLELVPQDSTSRLLHPIKSQGSSSTSSDGFDFNRYCDCVQEAFSGSQNIGNKSQETQEEPDPVANQLQSDGFDTLDSSIPKCDESVESSVGNPDMTGGGSQMTAINFDSEEDPSNQTDGVDVLGAIFNASQKFSMNWEEPESNDQTHGVKIDVLEGLTASQKVADNPDVNEEPETTDQTAVVAIDVTEGMIARQKIADNSDVSKESETSYQTAGIAIDVTEGMIARQKIADNSDVRKEPDTSYQTAGIPIDVMEGLNANHADNSYTMEEPERTDQTGGVTIDVMEGLIASQKISDNSHAIEGPERADKTAVVAHDVLDGLIVSKQTAKNSDAREEEHHFADQSQTDDIDSHKTENNSDSTEEELIPHPADQIDGVDVSDTIIASQITASKSNSREEDSNLIDQFQSDGVDAMVPMTPGQKILNNGKAREERDVAQQNVGFGIRDRILKWESKGKSVLSNDNKLPPSSSLAFDNVMKELRHVVPRDSKILKSKDEMGENCPEEGKQTWSSQRRPNAGVRGLLSEFALRIMHYTA